MVGVLAPIRTGTPRTAPGSRPGVSADSTTRTGDSMTLPPVRFWRRMAVSSRSAPVDSRVRIRLRRCALGGAPRVRRRVRSWQGTLDSHQLGLRSERSASAALACRRFDRCSHRTDASHSDWRAVRGSNPSPRLEGPRISRRSNRSVRRAAGWRAAAAHGHHRLVRAAGHDPAASGFRNRRSSRRATS